MNEVHHSLRNTPPQYPGLHPATGIDAFYGHVLLGLLCMPTSNVISSTDWWALLPFCLTSLGLLSLYVYRSLRREPSRALYEMSVFLAISSAVYLAFGPLLYVFGPSKAAEYSISWYYLGADEAVWITGLNLIGVGVAGVVYSLVDFQLVTQVAAKASTYWARIRPSRVFAAFLVSGLAAKYLVVLPFELRLTDTVPGQGPRQLGNLLLIALLIAWSHRSSGPVWMRRLAVLLLATEVVVGLLMFNKTAVLLAPLAAGLGYYTETRRFRTLLSLLVIGFVIYVFIGPVVNFGRNELIYRGNGQPVPADLSERFEITASYFFEAELHDHTDPVSGAWWSRLNYLPQQQAAVDFWRQGDGGDDMSLVPWLFVPRVLYPAKPIMTDSSIGFTEKVTGRRDSSTGLGVFIDGYYNWGWLGVVLSSLSYGMILRVYSNIARPVIRERALAMYPLAFTGLYVGLRVDGRWLTDVMGPVVFALLLLVGLWITART